MRYHHRKVFLKVQQCFRIKIVRNNIAILVVNFCQSFVMHKLNAQKTFKRISQIDTIYYSRYYIKQNLSSCICICHEIWIILCKMFKKKSLLTDFLTFWNPFFSLVSKQIPLNTLFRKWRNFFSLNTFHALKFNT